MNTAVNRGHARSADTGALAVVLLPQPAHLPRITFHQGFRAMPRRPRGQFGQTQHPAYGPLHLSAEPAHPDREFLASTDERFRPVALTHGPDGAPVAGHVSRHCSIRDVHDDHPREVTLRRGSIKASIRGAFMGRARAEAGEPPRN